MTLGVQVQEKLSGAPPLKSHERILQGLVFNKIDTPISLIYCLTIDDPLNVLEQKQFLPDLHDRTLKPTNLDTNLVFETRDNLGLLVSILLITPQE
ncbi:hypothetical protein J2X69_000723 [Algoriphagus sp. 4150]|nr:hypothetical protein [Algoriphagus sp. 4150]